MQALARWSEPDFAVASSTGSVALCGVLLLCLGVLAPQTDFSWLDPDLAELAKQAGQFVPSLIGAGLVMMAIGLSHRVNLAWGLTLVLLVVGAAFTATQDDRLWVASVLILTRIAGRAVPRLLLSPRQPAERSAGGVQRAVAGRAGDLPAGAGAYPPLHAWLLPNNAWWAVIMSREVPNSLRLAVALGVVLGLLAIWRLLRPGRVRWLPWDATARVRLGRDGRAAATAGRRAGHGRGGARRHSVPPLRAACCWGWATPAARKPIAFRPSGACATWRSRRASIRRSGAPGPRC